jgi:hypothetical protein
MCLVYGKIVHLDGSPAAWTRVTFRIESGVGAANGWVMPGLLVSGASRTVRSDSEGVFWSFLPQGTYVDVTLGSDLIGTSIVVPGGEVSEVDLSVLAFDYPAEFRWQYAFSSEPLTGEEVPAWQTAEEDGIIPWPANEEMEPSVAFGAIRLVAIWWSGRVVFVAGTHVAAESTPDGTTFGGLLASVRVNKWRAAGYAPGLRAPAQDSLALPPVARVQYTPSLAEEGDEGEP